MYCQFTSLRPRNVIVKCFNQACYHVANAKAGEEIYCEVHVHKLPRRTKVELLLDVIELPPSEISGLKPTDSENRTATEWIRSSAGSIASISDLTIKPPYEVGFLETIETSCSTIEHDKIMNLQELDSDKVPVDVSFGGKQSTVTRGDSSSCINFTYLAAKARASFDIPFRNLGQLCECYGHLPRPKTWRMLANQVPGNINGLPKMRGMAIATNGIHVAIENAACTQLYIGHLQWFVIDDLNAPANAREILQGSAVDALKVVRNQLKQFDELW